MNRSQVAIALWLDFSTLLLIAVVYYNVLFKFRDVSLDIM
jgi:hypothetical protein